MSSAADRQQPLRRGQRDHCCRWQQGAKHAQQYGCRNPPHAASVHVIAVAAKRGPLVASSKRMQLAPVIAAAIEAGVSGC